MDYNKRYYTFDQILLITEIMVYGVGCTGTKLMSSGTVLLVMIHLSGHDQLTGSAFNPY